MSINFKKIIDNVFPKEELTEWHGPGAYELYSNVTDFGLKPHYIGRADTDLERRLDSHSHCPVCGAEIVDIHAYCADSAEQAYMAECELWHKWLPRAKGGSLCNQNHPDCPDGGGPPCPVCNRDCERG